MTDNIWGLMVLVPFVYLALNSFHFINENRKLRDEIKIVRSNNLALDSRQRELDSENSRLRYELYHGFKPSNRLDLGSLSKKELMGLISLVHPDKHNGSQVATEWTAKLLALRK